MSLLTQIKTEIKNKERENSLSKRDVLALENAFFKDNAKECEKCKRIEFLTLDHIIPLDILRQFGIDVERTYIKENLRILCRICNQFKGNHLDFSTPKTKKLLLKFLEKI